MSQLEQLLAESGLGPDDELARILAPLAHKPAAPPPSVELAAVFARVGVQVSRTARATRVAAGGIVAAALSLGGTGLAAAANTLPSPLQDQVSAFSHRYLPFDFPRPARQRPVPAPVPHLPSAQDEPARGEQPGTTAGQRLRTLRAPTPQPVQSAAAARPLATQQGQAESLPVVARPAGLPHRGRSDSDDQHENAPEGDSTPGGTHGSATTMGAGTGAPTGHGDTDGGGASTGGGDDASQDVTGSRQKKRTAGNDGSDDGSDDRSGDGSGGDNSGDTDQGETARDVLTRTLAAPPPPLSISQVSPTKSSSVLPGPGGR